MPFLSLHPVGKKNLNLENRDVYVGKANLNLESRTRGSDVDDGVMLISL